MGTALATCSFNTCSTSWLCVEKDSLHQSHLQTASEPELEPCEELGMKMGFCLEMEVLLLVPVDVVLSRKVETRVIILMMSELPVAVFLSLSL